MKTINLRLCAVAFAAAVAGAVGCGQSGCGGGGTNLNSNTPTSVGMQCGQGTYLNGTQCVPLPSSNSGGNAALGTSVGGTSTSGSAAPALTPTKTN
jgi:hypothetical protein